MIINKTNIKGFFVNLRLTFQDALKRAPAQWEKVAMKTPSNTKSEDYNWFNDFPAMRKWIGEKKVKLLAASRYTIVNDDWETTIEVDRNDLEDDNTGQYASRRETPVNRRPICRAISSLTW